jgi:carboxylesterase type B
MRDIKLKLSQGVIRGCEEKLPDGRWFKRFSRIPYAHPPVADLRFRDPKKLLKFQEPEIDCTRENNFECYHSHMLNNEPIGSEDCLYLNVYVPPKQKEKLPVMFYIHGGKTEFNEMKTALKILENFQVDFRLTAHRLNGEF